MYVLFARNPINNSSIICLLSESFVVLVHKIPFKQNGGYLYIIKKILRNISDDNSLPTDTTKTRRKFGLTTFTVD